MSDKSYPGYPQVYAENTIPTLDLAKVTIEEAHFELGRILAPQVQRILAHRYKKNQLETMERSKTLANNQLFKIETLRFSSKVPALIREGLRVYLDCLDHWSRGIGFTTGYPPAWTPLEIAMYLQSDHPGCQSGVYRSLDGNVLFWHTEEDVDELEFPRVDQSRMMCFHNPFFGVEVNSFIYPDLLPGPNFNWRSDGFVQFADTLILREDCRQGGIPANVIAWLSLLLTPMIPLPMIIECLQPIFDGYAIFCLIPEDEKVSCMRLEFTMDQVQESILPSTTSAVLAQSNAFSKQADLMAERFEPVHFPSRRHFETRIRRAERELQIAPIRVNLGRIGRLIASREGGRWAFANKDVKAHLFGRLSSKSLEIHSHPGMGLNPGSG